MPDTNDDPSRFRSILTEWRHDLHRHPELGFDVARTAGFVADSLRDFGLSVQEGIGGGVVGVLRRGNGPSIGLRADMDALAIQEENTFGHASTVPGRMHACGHDGHTAMLLGAAKRLSEEGGFDGEIVFIFQPAEEHGQGAKAMMADGLFDRYPVDAVYALHNMPSIPAGHIAVRPGPIMACEDNFEIVIQGKGGHAALPHMTVDPIVVGSEIVLSLQTLASRHLDPLEPCVLSVTDFHVDATRNVIPDKVVLRGDVRAFTPRQQSAVEDGMRRITEGVAAAHGASATVVYTHEFAATINDSAAAEQVAATASRVLGPDRVDKDCRPVMASEDFGFMLERKPGCYFLLGNGGTGPGGCGLHSPNYDFNDEILTIGADLWVQLVCDCLPAEG
ncbi:MAG: amidohydrolase [Alphaproteobacteria bacterium]|nr:amidohydrolase [Alphaproteobacteria bacterium]MBO6861547.1 amidohydrolase [Alphaproteobacteria bacterium]